MRHLERRILQEEFEDRTFIFRGTIDSSIIYHRGEDGKIKKATFRLTYTNPIGSFRRRFIARGSLAETIKNDLRKGQEVAIIGNPTQIPYKPGRCRTREYRDGIGVCEIQPI